MKTKKTIIHQFAIRCISLLLAFSCITALFPTSVSALGIDYYTIKNVGSGKVLNVHGNKDANNVDVTLWDDDGTSGVHWRLIKRKGAYVITPECALSRALNIYGDKAHSGSRVCLWSQTGHSTQGWIIEPVKGGYILRSENNKNLVLSANGSSNGSKVLVKTYNASDRLQVWNSKTFNPRMHMDDEIRDAAHEAFPEFF